MPTYLFPAVFAFLLTLLLTFLALKLFPLLGLMDRPAKYGLKRKAIPYYGGLVIYLSFVVAALLFVKMDASLIALLGGATLILVVSFLDDLYGLSPWLRLFVQLVAALILVFAGIGIHSISNPLGEPFTLDTFITAVTLDKVYTISILSALFTIIWVMGLVNTMNWMDGLHGLPSGITMIAACIIFLLSIRPDINRDLSSQVSVATLSIILAACAFAFWCFDFYPAKILMGDTGSMFLGFVLATLAIFSGGKVATAFLVLGFPILDAVWVVMRRIWQKKSPLRGDKKHFHHRLLEVGLSERKALYLIYALSAGFGLIAVYVEGLYKLYAIAALCAVMIILGFCAVYFAKE